MSLKHWADNSWLKPHKTSAKEIADLLAIVERDLRDAETGGTSDDWRFGIAYNAALKLCTVLLAASGYRPAQSLAHYRTLAALPLILGVEHKDDADYLDTCRGKRNVVEYEHIGAVSASDANELIAYARELHPKVLAWLQAQHPELLARPSSGKK